MATAMDGVGKRSVVSHQRDISSCARICTVTGGGSPQCVRVCRGLMTGRGKRRGKEESVVDWERIFSSSGEGERCSEESRDVWRDLSVYGCASRGLEGLILETGECGGFFERKCS